MNETPPSPPTTLMILRAWVEPTSDKPLRVRVRFNGAPGDEDQYMADPGAVGKLVEDWLDGLIVATK
jgi:hypothetical protein